MYQEVLDEFYIVSKRLGMHITGPVIANLFEHDYIEEDNFEVSTTVFVHRLSRYINQHDKHGNEVNYDIVARDLKFLATKYISEPDINRPEARYANYLQFIEDYLLMENEGIGSGKRQVMFENRFFKRDVS